MPATGPLPVPLRVRVRARLRADVPPRVLAGVGACGRPRKRVRLQVRARKICIMHIVDFGLFLPKSASVFEGQISNFEGHNTKLSGINQHS